MEPLSILMLAVWGGWGALFVARRYKEEKAHVIEKLEEFAAPLFRERRTLDEYIREEFSELTMHDILGEEKYAESVKLLAAERERANAAEARERVEWNSRMAAAGERRAARIKANKIKVRTSGKKRLAKLKANTKNLEPAKLNRLRDLCREATELTGVAHEIDHMDSVHNGGGNDIDNLRIISATENRRKGRRSI